MNLRWLMVVFNVSVFVDHQGLCSLSSVSKSRDGLLFVMLSRVPTRESLIVRVSTVVAFEFTQ